jgi:hypothetical protein
MFRPCTPMDLERAAPRLDAGPAGMAMAALARADDRVSSWARDGGARAAVVG